MRALLLTMLVLAGGLSAAAAQQTGPKPDPTHVPYRLPADIEWTKDPEFGYYGAKLFGDASKPGMYGILIKWPPHTFSTPHIHNGDRYVYVVSGTWWVSSSAHYDPSQTYPLPAGSFATDLAGQVHWDGAKDQETILELIGMGPATTTKVPEK